MSSTYFDINCEYEFYDKATMKVTYLGSFVKSELAGRGSHADRYYFYFRNNGNDIVHDICVHPVNPAFTGIRKKQ